MSRVKQSIRNRRGTVLALVAVSLAVLLGGLALAVDVSMLYKTRADAQRAADAAALAGASAYREYMQPIDARDDARQRAREFAAQNYVGNKMIDTTGETVTTSGTKMTSVSSEAAVEVMPDDYKVRVWVRRVGTGTFFGRIFGIGSAPVQARATARAVNASGAKCVKPFAIADAWQDAEADANANRFWDDGEEWEYNPVTDYYKPYQGDPVKYGNGHETGYGSEFRNQPYSTYTKDFGRQIVIKPQDPQEDHSIKPGNFYAWNMPDDSTMNADCGVGGESSGGAAEYSKNICTCNNSTVTLGTEYETQQGNMKGPTKQGMEDLIAQDPNATWDPNADGGRGAVTGSSYGENWRDSPRVIKVAVYDPAEVHKSGKLSIEFTNIALMFVEGMRQEGEGPDKTDAVVARFLTYAEGTGAAGPTGPLTLILKLVE